MTLRLTSREQLAHLPEGIRRQLEDNFDQVEGESTPETARSSGQGGERRRLKRPEQDAGRELVKWADRTPLGAGVLHPLTAPASVVSAIAALSHAERAELFPQLDPKGPPAGVVTIGHFLVHTPNGGWRGGGKEAAIFQGQGVRADWPDYTLALPIGRYSGLELELKASAGGAPCAGQLVTLRRLELVSARRAVVCWGFEDARRAIETYLAAR